MEKSRYAVRDSPPPPSLPQVPVAQPEPILQPEVVQAPLYDMDPSIDEFAQTRPPDDLFDDDFTPITHSEPVLDPPAPAPAPVAQETASEPPQFLREPPKGPRGRGGRRGGGGGGGRASPPRAPVEPATEDDAAESAATPTPKPERKETAVRGDRSGTGGVKKAKLTEDELAAKLEAMSLKNAALQEAHARSQRDIEAFEAREAIATQRRKEERQNRQQMMGEREKNRQRKLQAVGGREWDVEKNEEDFRTEEGRKAKRGAHGGVSGSRYATATPTGSVAEQAEELIGEYKVRGGAERGRGRGRGGRGRGRGNDTGHFRGGLQQAPNAQAPPKAADFPDLPQASSAPKEETVKPPAQLNFPNKQNQKTDKVAPTELDTKAGTESKEKGADEAKPKLAHQMSFGLSSPSGEKKSWADQVEGMA